MKKSKPPDLQAASAAGKSSSTSVNVTGNDLGLTMTPLASNQWNQTNVTVSGFINDGSYTVKVNGVTATIVGDPTWFATVPLPAGEPGAKACGSCQEPYGKSWTNGRCQILSGRPRRRCR